MKLEVGMYVRSNEGISKIIDIKDVYAGKFIATDNKRGNVHYSNEYTGYIIDLEDKQWNKDHIKDNIIDLIEEKDLLEIEYFPLRYEKRVTRLFEVTFKDGKFINLDNAKCQFMLIDNDWTDNDKELEPIIKSIVTKEQFESMSYKVGE